MVAPFNNFISLTGNLNPSTLFNPGNRPGKDSGGQAAPRPRVKTFDQIRANLLQPALTSHFIVHITEPEGGIGMWGAVKKENDVETVGFTTKQDQLMLLCSEALLPGSTFATHQITSDRTGVTERHVYRRQFDDRIDLTFFVNAGENAYLPIRFFETWMKYISVESFQQTNSVQDPNYSYRVRYPNEYYGGLSVTKFERSHDSEIKYNFVNAYPTSIVSMPVSYDTSQMMKCTVSFSYVRYWIESVPGEAHPPTSKSMDYNKPGPPSKPPILPTTSDGKPAPPPPVQDDDFVPPAPVTQREAASEKLIQQQMTKTGLTRQQIEASMPGGNSLPVNPRLSERLNHLGRNLHEDKQNPITSPYGAGMFPGITPPGSGTGSKNSSNNFELKDLNGKPFPTTK